MRCSVFCLLGTEMNMQNVPETVTAQMGAREIVPSLEPSRAPSAGSFYELQTLVSVSDYAVIESIAREMGSDVATLTATAVRFYYPLTRKVWKENCAIQHGPSIRNLVPYTLHSKPPEDWEAPSRMLALSPEERSQQGPKKSGSGGKSLPLVVSGDVLKQLQDSAKQVGIDQFLLDGIKCYSQLRESWINGNRIFLERAEDELILSEIAMEMFEPKAD